MIATVDASTATKWYFAERYSEAATRLLDPVHILIAPDLLLAEFGNVVWKHVRRGDVAVAEALDTLAALLNVPIDFYPSASVINLALDLACETGRTVYDCMYLALARAAGCQLVTADQRFYNALQRSPYATTLMWVEDVT